MASSNFGQGGRTNAYPSRTFPRGVAAWVQSFQGGARGPAALPARILFSPPAAPPNMAGGQVGPNTEASPYGDIRRAPAWVGARWSPGNQQYGQADNTYDHDTIEWSRPYYPNAAGLAGYLTPTAMTSWTANAPASASDQPTVPIPISHKRIDSFTINEEYGSTRQLFPLWGTRRPDSGIVQSLRNRAVQAKTSNPWNVLLTRFGLAGSYGSSTPTLPTQPVVAAANPAPTFGAY